MEEIRIEFTGKYNLVLNGELIGHNSGRNNVWRVRLIDDDSEEKVYIPSSTFEDTNGTMTVITDHSTTSPTFWSIDLIKKQKQTICIITGYPNAFELTKHLSEK